MGFTYTAMRCTETFRYWLMRFWPTCSLGLDWVHLLNIRFWSGLNDTYVMKHNFKLPVWKFEIAFASKLKIAFDSIQLIFTGLKPNIGVQTRI